MSRRAARRIRLGIHLGRDDVRAVRLGLPPLGPMLLAHTHPLTGRAWERTVQGRMRALLAGAKR